MPAPTSLFERCHRTWRHLQIAAGLMLLTATLAVSACGSGDGSGQTVATIGARTRVSRATLDHWMKIALGGDYRPLFHEVPPAGLLSDPPDYARCTTGSEAIPRVPGKPKVAVAQRRLKCHQLYAAIREQALNSILSALWIREEAHELGIHAPSVGEVSGRLRLYVAHDFKGPADFSEALAEQQRSLSDVRYMIESTLLQASINNRLTTKAKRLGGEPQTELYKLILQNRAGWKARTICSSGYRSSSCKQYPTGSEIKPSPNIVLEHFRKGIGD